MNEGHINLLYDLVEYMERERRRLFIATVIVLLVVPLALVLNLIGFFSITRWILITDADFIGTLFRGGRSFFSIYFVVTLNTITSIALVFLGIKNLLFLKAWDKKLNKIKKIEKKIHDEVFKDKGLIEN